VARGCQADALRLNPSSGLLAQALARRPGAGAPSPGLIALLGRGSRIAAWHERYRYGDVRTPCTSGLPLAWLAGYGVDHADARGCRRVWCPGAGVDDPAGRARWPVAGRARPGRPGGANAGADRPDRVRGRRGGGRGHIPAGGRRVPAAGPARSDLAIQRRAAGRAEGREQHRGGAPPAPAAARSQAGRARADTAVVRT
jgi:hypothetical protein